MTEETIRLLLEAWRGYGRVARYLLPRRATKKMDPAEAELLRRIHEQADREELERQRPAPSRR